LVYFGGELGAVPEEVSEPGSRSVIDDLCNALAEEVVAIFRDRALSWRSIIVRETGPAQSGGLDLRDAGEPSKRVPFLVPLRILGNLAARIERRRVDEVGGFGRARGVEVVVRAEFRDLRGEAGSEGR
jgi:hypothetical protein